MRRYSIYEIVNKVNGKKYIGMSCQFQERINQHFRHLRNNTHYSKEFQRDYNKNHQFHMSEIYKDLPKCIAEDYEKYFISKLGTMSYNFMFSGKKRKPLTIEQRDRISKGRSGISTGKNNHFYGKKHSEESINKMRKTLSKHDRTLGNNAFAKKVYYKGKIFNSVKECIMYTGFTRYGFYKEIKKKR